jgi:3',5'-cyclic AMP phosphodiesterase CpdA
VHYGAEGQKAQGNHDVCNEPTPETLTWYKKTFGEPWYSFTVNHALFIVLESDTLKNPKYVAKEKKEQLEWLKKTLSDADKSKTPPKLKIVFMHHPLYQKTVDEKDTYWNMPVDIRNELLKLFTDHKVNAVFSGHRHRNEYQKNGDIELITTTSCTHKRKPVGFRIVKVHADKIEQKFYSYDDMPEKD